eukprot:Sspe_Gene.86870::Locus_57666_Transcript_1_1_Confidence_1.000_Length_1742::g.86870::m.86870
MGDSATPQSPLMRRHPRYRRLGTAEIRRAQELLDGLVELGLPVDGLVTEIEQCMEMQEEGQASTPAPRNVDLEWLAPGTRVALGETLCSAVEELVEYLVANKSFRQSCSSTLRCSRNSITALGGSGNVSPINPYQLIREWSRQKDYEFTTQQHRPTTVPAGVSKRPTSARAVHAARQRSSATSKHLPTREEMAAVKIQKVLRGWIARKEATRRRNRAMMTPEELEGVAERVLSFFVEMKELEGNIRELSQMGSPSDEDLEELEYKQHLYDTKKYAVADILNKIPYGCRVPIPPERIDLITETFIHVMHEGDQRDGSCEIVASLLATVEVDWGEVIENENLVALQCGDGNQTFLKLLLDHLGPRSTAFDPAEVVVAACYSQLARIPLTAIVLDRIPLKVVYDEVKDTLQEFFEDICSHKKALPKEIRTGVHTLIRSMATHPVIDLDWNRQDAVGHTIFSRCCADGDLLLLDIIRLHAPKGTISPNEVLGDQTTPLMQAVYRNQLDMVKALVSDKNCDANIATEQGSALGWAMQLQRTEIAQVLKAAGATVVKFLPSAKG